LACEAQVAGKPQHQADGKISVLIVDDHEMVADALRQALERTDDVQVVGCAATVAQCLQMAQARNPDLVLMDYHLPDGTGVEATRQLLADFPELIVVMLTGSADATTASAALMAGCTGFVSKDESVNDLVRSIRKAVCGEVVVPPDLLPALVAHARPPKSTLGADLTEREREVLALLGRGRSTDEIVADLSLSPHTVRNHIRNVLTKLNAHSRLEGVAIAGRVGIISLGADH
jgi:DNA-binding NarL/FixJ family response regulator